MLTTLAARILLAILVVFLLPLAVHALWWATRDGRAPNWGSADWSSARLLPPPAAKPAALVYVYAARTGRWKGIFAHHSWIVVKERNAARYTRYDKVGWGRPVRTDGWPPDGRWFSNPPELVVAIEGEAAERLVPRVRAAVAGYPYGEWGRYRAWPGPNSNTFVAHVMREVPELSAALPPTAARQGLAPDRQPLRLDPEPHRHRAVARRLPRRRHRLGRGHRGQFPRPRRRPRPAPPGPEAPRLGTDRHRRLRADPPAPARG